MDMKKLYEAISKKYSKLSLKLKQNLKFYKGAKAWERAGEWDTEEFGVEPIKNHCFYLMFDDGSGLSGVELKDGRFVVTVESQEGDRKTGE